MEPGRRGMLINSLALPCDHLAGGRTAAAVYQLKVKNLVVTRGRFLRLTPLC
jgi:hypothetical protein